MVCSVGSVGRLDVPFLRVFVAQSSLQQDLAASIPAMLLYGECLRVLLCEDGYCKVQLLVDKKPPMHERSECFWIREIVLESSVDCYNNYSDLRGNAQVLTRRWTPLICPKDQTVHLYLPMGSVLQADDRATVSLGRYQGLSIGEKEWRSLNEISELKQTGSNGGSDREELQSMYRWWVVNTAKNLLGTALQPGGCLPDFPQEIPLQGAPEIEATGMDDAGFIFLLWKKLGVQIPRQAQLQQVFFEKYQKEKAPLCVKPGDLLFRRSKRSQKIVQISLFENLNQLIHMDQNCKALKRQSLVCSCGASLSELDAGWNDLYDDENTQVCVMGIEGLFTEIFSSIPA